MLQFWYICSIYFQTAFWLPTTMSFDVLLTSLSADHWKSLSPLQCGRFHIIRTTSALKARLFPFFIIHFWVLRAIHVLSWQNVCNWYNCDVIGWSRRFSAWIFEICEHFKWIFEYFHPNIWFMQCRLPMSMSELELIFEYFHPKKLIFARQPANVNVCKWANIWIFSSKYIFARQPMPMSMSELEPAEWIFASKLLQDQGQRNIK